jgi:hypothetical protein
MIYATTCIGFTSPSVSGHSCILQVKVSDAESQPNLCWYYIDMFFFILWLFTDQCCLCES